MSGIKTGVDSKGRRYKTVNGKRVTAVGDKAKAEPRASSFLSPNALRDPLRKIMMKYFREGGGEGAIKNSIGHVINQHLNQLFAIQATTSVGKFGKAYAARMMLNALRTGDFNENERNEDDTRLLKSMTKDGDLDGHKFLSHLKSQGVPIQDVPEPTKATDELSPALSKDQRMKYNPTRTNLIVQVVKKPDRSPGGILIPEVARQKSCKGIVIAVGPGELGDDGNVKPFALANAKGYNVLFAEYSGHNFEDENGVEFRVLHEKDILASWL
jgi:chaperonin GroES